MLTQLLHDKSFIVVNSSHHCNLLRNILHTQASDLENKNVSKSPRPGSASGAELVLSLQVCLSEPNASVMRSYDVTQFVQQQPAVAPAQSQEVNVCARTKTLRRSGI